MIALLLGLIGVIGLGTTPQFGAQHLICAVLVMIVLMMFSLMSMAMASAIKAMAARVAELTETQCKCGGSCEGNCTPPPRARMVEPRNG